MVLGVVKVDITHIPQSKGYVTGTAAVSELRDYIRYRYYIK